MDFRPAGKGGGWLVFAPIPEPFGVPELPLDSGRRKKQSGSRQVPSASAHRPCPMLSAFIRVRQRPEKTRQRYL